MCGIAGFIGPYDRTTLATMTERMHHRGPDETGYYFSTPENLGANVGLGHKRLSIIDLSSGRQPMANEDGTLRVVFNGEIYNHSSLRRELESHGHRFSTRCDTEVLLHGYEQFGADVVHRLEGMFAFAIWDERRRELFLARDRFGIKPLYFCEPAPEQLVFASEIKPLLRFVGGADLHLPALYRYLSFGWNSDESTIFRDVRQLRPAHWLRYCDGRAELRRYWRLPEDRQEGDLATSAEILREGLQAAVKSHLAADVPVGIALSGGLDSSAVLGLAARVLPRERIQSFTIGYGTTSDETPYARAVADHVGVVNHERIIPIDRVVDSFERLLQHLEEPIVHPVLGTTYFLAQFIREHVKVVLIGEGSDELFGGYPHFKLFTKPYSWAPQRLTQHLLPGAAFVMPDVRALAELLHPDLLDRPLLEEVGRTFAAYQGGADPAQNWLRCELEHELVHSQLARIDKLTMAHSIEARVPFLDREFAEAAYRLPFAMKHAGGVEKAILRRALQDILPPQITHRPKSGRRGTQNLLPLMNDQLCRGRLSNLIAPETIRRRGWFRPEAVRTYLAGADSWVTRRRPIEGRRRTKFRFALATIEQWARTFLDDAAIGSLTQAA